LATEICESQDEFSISYWDDFNDKTHCFDCGDLISPFAIESNLGIDVGIVLNLMDNVRMSRDYIDNNGIWAKAVKIIRKRCFANDLKIRDPALRHANMSSNMSRL
jgi:hypothetical protein